MSLTTDNVNTPRTHFTSPAFAILWLIVALVVYYTTNGSTMTYHNILTWLATASYVLALVCWLRRGNRLFSLFTLFVVYALFSNLGQSLLMSFGLEIPLSGLYINFFMFDICRMLKFQYICAAAFYFGVCWYLRYSNRCVSAIDSSRFYEQVVKRKGSATILEVIMFICLLGVFFFTIYQLRLRQTMSYHDLYTSRELVPGFFIFGSVVLGLDSIFRKRHVLIVLFFWTWYILAYFMAGTRSMSIVYFGALVFVLPIVKPEWFEKRTYIIWLSVAALGLASINIISEMRQMSLGGMDSLSVDGFDIAVFNSVAEMGASEYPTMVTISEIDQGFPHSQTILYHLLLGFIPAPLLNMFVPSNWTIQLGQWVTDAVNSYNELGYSWVAESYMNYGSFGWLFTLIYGWFVAMAENYSLRRIQSGQYILAICLIGILCRQLFFARGQIALSLPFYRYSIYFIVLLLFAKNIKQNIVKI